MKEMDKASRWAEEYAAAMTQDPQQRRREVWHIRRLLDRMDEADAYIGHAGLPEDVQQRFTALLDELITLEPPEDAEE